MTHLLAFLASPYVLVPVGVAVMVVIPILIADHLADRAALRPPKPATPVQLEQVQPRQALTDAPPPPLPREEPPVTAPAPAADPLLVPAPVVDMPDGQVVTLHAWANSVGDGEATFRAMVVDFYTANLTDPQVRGYFPAEGTQGLSELRRHFAAAFITLAREGLNLSTANYLADKHAGVRSTDGQPITGEVFDRVISNLVTVLTSSAYGVPNTPECLGRLAEMVGLARPLIVQEAT